MSAENYNRIRRILFSTANNRDKGFAVAYEWMENTYRKQLDSKSYFGLMAELKFYENHAKEFFLTVAGDMGEHADFAGSFGSQPARFDVTTNIRVKKFETYEPYMGDGPVYKIALMDAGNFEVIDVLDLAFQKCNACGGYLIPTVVLLDENHDRNGESQWTNDQLLIDVCTGCEEYMVKERFTHTGLSSAREMYNALDNSDEFAINTVDKHVVSAYRYFRRQHSDYLMAIGSHNYRTTKPTGDGYWSVGFDFINSAVKGVLPAEVRCQHDI